MKAVSLAVLLRDGYIQEANRQFFHPLGLSLTVLVNGQEPRLKALLVMDYRDDPEGVVFADGVMLEEKAEFVEREMKIRRPARVAATGFWKQPVKKINEPDRPRRR